MDNIEIPKKMLLKELHYTKNIGRTKVRWLDSVEANARMLNIRNCANDSVHLEMLEVTCNDRLGKKVRVKCNPDDTIGDLKKLIAAQTGTRWDKIVLKKWYTVFKDHITLEDYEIHDGMNLELYYQ